MRTHEYMRAALSVFAESISVAGPTLPAPPGQSCLAIRERGVDDATPFGCEPTADPRARTRRLPGAAREKATEADGRAIAPAAVAHPLLSPRSRSPFPAASAHYADLPSLESLDTLPAATLSGVVAELAARQAQLAALQARAAARLAATPTVASASDPRIAPGQRLSAHQLAERMGRSVDYVYRHADEWPFTIREGRSVTFDEAGFARWQQKRTAANGARRREVP